jgi:hypothetical protein
MCSLIKHLRAFTVRIYCHCALPDLRISFPFLPPCSELDSLRLFSPNNRFEFKPQVFVLILYISLELNICFSQHLA